ncbi:MAG: serine hydrolase domain-containing protein [Clostridiaceae bacterium]|nr:serine hydrolase domain-containing protein [Clostridiaceae bacterium]
MLKRELTKTVFVFLVTALIILALTPSVLAKSIAPADSEEFERFCDDFFSAKMSEYHVPGAAVVIVKDGKAFFSKGYGYANIEKKIPVEPQKTIFRVASVSKIFTITGILQLEESGLIDINNDVNSYLTNFQVENNYDEPIRIKYLLTHTDGFETRDLGTFVQDTADLLPLESILKNDLNGPVQTPGSKITYGGYGTALAGYLISQVKNESFEEYMNNKIFHPLNMTNSTFQQDLPDNLKENIATVYNFKEDTNKFIPTQFLYVNTAPTGALSTTPEDMGKFLIALLGGGQYGGNTILQEDTVEKMFNRQYTVHPSLPGVTYGFMESLCNGQKGLVRDGSGVGIRSQIFLLPEHNIGYFYVQNTRGDEMVEEFNDAFMDRFFPDSDKEIKPEKAMDINKLARYEGIYRPSQTARHTLVKMEALAMGDLEIKADENRELIITVLGEQEIYGGFPKVSKWVAIEPLLFRRIDAERYMAFQENEEGQIINVTSGSGYHGSFVKIPRHESNRTQLYLLISYITVFLGAVIVSLIKFAKGQRNQLQISGILSLLFIVGIFGALYSLFIKRVAGFPAFAFGVSLPAKLMLTLLAVISVLSIGFLILLIKNWRAGKMKLFDKIFYSIVMMSFIGMVFWLHYWNLLGYKY